MIPLRRPRPKTRTMRTTRNPHHNNAKHLEGQLSPIFCADEPRVEARRGPMHRIASE